MDDAFTIFDLLEYPLPTTNNHHLISSLFQIESQSITSTTDSDFRRQIIYFISHYSFFDPFVSYLAINYLHRFLSNHPSSSSILQETNQKPWILRLLAISCVSLALKMRNTELPLAHIQDVGGDGFIFDKQTIGRMELLILGALKWRMRSITPFSFINFFLSLFKHQDPSFARSLKTRATQIIFSCQHELKTLEFKASIVAASALLSASQELFPLQFPSFKKAMTTCSYVNKVSLSKCNKMMEEIAMDGNERVEDRVQSKSNTPINVLDREWLSSSSDSYNVIGDSGTNIKVEVRASKRRKVISSYSFTSNGTNTSAAAAAAAAFSDSAVPINLQHTAAS